MSFRIILALQFISGAIPNQNKVDRENLTNQILLKIMNDSILPSEISSQDNSDSDKFSRFKDECSIFNSLDEDQNGYFKPKDRNVLKNILMAL